MVIQSKGRKFIKGNFLSSLKKNIILNLESYRFYRALACGYIGLIELFVHLFSKYLDVPDILRIRYIATDVVVNQADMVWCLP